MIVHDVEHLAFDSSFQSRKHDRLGAVVNVRKRYRVGTAEMEKDPKGIDPHPRSNALIARTVDIPGPDDDVRDPTPVPILGDDLLLSDLCEAIGVTAERGIRLNRARFIQQSATRFLPVGVNREGTDVDEAAQQGVPQASFEKISCRDHRVHERVGKGLFPSAGGQVKDNRHALSSNCAVLGGKKISFEHYNSCSFATAASDGFYRRHVTGGPGKTTQVTKSAIQQTCDKSGPNEPGGPRY